MDVMNKLLLLISMSFITNLRAMESEVPKRSKSCPALAHLSLATLYKNQRSYPFQVDALPVELQCKYRDLKKYREKQDDNRIRNALYALKALRHLKPEDKESYKDRLIEFKRDTLIPTSQEMDDNPNASLAEMAEVLHDFEQMAYLPSIPSNNPNQLDQDIVALTKSMHSIVMSLLVHQLLSPQQYTVITDIPQETLKGLYTKISGLSQKCKQCIENIERIEIYDFTRKEFEEIKHAEVLKPLLLLQKDSHLSEIFMQYAIESLDQSTVEVLIDHGLNRNKALNGDMSPLFSILMPRESKMHSKQKEVLLSLLERGVDLKTEFDESTPLWVTIGTVRPDLAQCLVAYGADVRFQEKETQYNYLHKLLKAACQHKHRREIEVDLIQRFADILPIADLVNQQDGAHMTPLFDAAILGNLSIMKELVETYGADITIPDSNNKTCVEIARVARSNQEMVEYLEAKERELNN